MAGSSGSRPFYSKWVWKDWIAKSQGQTTLEKGAEMALFGFAATCSPDLCSVPDDDVVLARIAGVRLDRWRKIAPQVLRNWARLPSGRWQHTRLLEDARLWSQHCENQRLRRTGGEPAVDRGLTDGAPDGHPARSRESQIEAQRQIELPALDSDSPALPVAVEHPPRSESKNADRKPHANGEARAEWLEAFSADFYPGYPRKVEPDDARKAWLSIKPWNQETCNLICDGLDRWVEYWKDQETDRKHIPYPGRFLRSGAWKGDPG